MSCRRDTMISGSRTDYQMEHLLRHINVYIDRHDQRDDQFLVAIFEFAAMYARQNIGGFRARLYLGDCAGAGLDAAEVLERLVEHVIIVRSCMAPPRRTTTWRQLAFPLLNDISHCDQKVCIDQNCPLQRIPGVGGEGVRRLGEGISKSKILARKCIHPLDLPRVMEASECNRIYRPRDKSASADTFVKQKDFVLEIQDKCCLTTVLAFNAIRAEVGKSLQSCDVVLLFIAMKLGSEVSQWVGPGVLTLTAGWYAPSSASHAQLLYAALGSDQWTHRIMNGQRSCIEGKQPERGHECLHIRQGLEVVLPSEASVRKFLGEADFETVKKLAENTEIDLPLVSKLMGYREGAM